MFDNMAAQCASFQILQVLPCCSRRLIESPLGQGEEMESREREEEKCNEEGDRDKTLALRVRWREQRGWGE